MSKREEIIHTYRCTDPFGESCTMACEECEKEIAKMLDDFEKEIRANERRKVLHEQQVSAEEIRADERRKFAEWLIDEVLAEYGKEQENEDTI